MTTFRILQQVILRTPLFSYTDYEASVSDALLQNPLFRAALYFASPTFYRLLATKHFDTGKLNEKELLSLAKYYNRMSVRPTPFGLFSSFTLSSWGEREQIVIGGAANFKIHVQADQELAIVAGRLLNNYSNKCTYFINPTLYRLGPEFRFIKSVLRDNSPKLDFSLEAVEFNRVTKKLVTQLKKALADGEAITKFLQAETGCTTPEATDYLNFLKDSQVILSSIGPNITGPDYFSRIQPLLQSNSRLKDHFTDKLPGNRQQFHPEIVRSAEAYADSLKAELTALQFKTPEKLFYINSEKPLEIGSLDRKYQQSILNAVTALTRLCLPGGAPLLDEFVKDFKNRFGDRKIPLLQAMDPDAGIGYGNLAEISTGTTLLKDIQFTSQQYPAPGLAWSAIHQLLLKKWKALRPGNEVISLDTGDLEALPEHNTHDLPPSISVHFRIVAGKAYIESAGGATGTSLIGRFTPFSKDVADLSREIAGIEIITNPGVIFAEVAQLSDHHIDNVNRRHNPFDYEIPVNCVSLMPKNQQINPADLEVSIQNDQVILESVRLKKRVIPRLSSAFNYQHNKLSIFRFLCDLQAQSVQTSLNFDLENYFPGMNHYPRVEFEGTILALAKWQLKKDDIQELTAADPSVNMAAAVRLREKFDLPPVIAITSADQQLVFNLENELQVKLFTTCISGMNQVTLQEYLLPGEFLSSVITTDGKPVINQFIAFLVNEQTVFRPPAITVKKCNSKARDFILGSNWLYFKLYCTPSAANELLQSRILPVLQQLSKEGPLTWFFIRYADPANHIRLRIKVNDNRIIKVITLLESRFSGLIRNDLVRDYMTDTYRREMERYGEDMIELCEDFFHASSELVLHFLKNNERLSPSVDAHVMAISSIGLLLDRMLPGMDDQLLFLESGITSFIAEFKIEKQQQVDLDKAYRKLRPDFSILAATEAFYEQLKIKKFLDRYIHSVSEICARCERFTSKRKNQLLADLIHMHLNRVFTDRQRKLEMVLYYYFLKHKLSGRARAVNSGG